MKIIKEGICPDTPMRGTCELCGCVFELPFVDTICLGGKPYVYGCPSEHCNHRGYIDVRRAAPTSMAELFAEKSKASGGGQS